MKSIKSSEVFAAASRVLAGSGRCRGAQESFKKGCCFDFKLGPWKGQVECTTTSTDFFRWLCTPEAMKNEADAEVREAGKNCVQLRFERSFEGFDGHLEVVEIDPPKDLKARLERAVEISPRDRRWRAATALTRAGVRVPLHGCYMFRGAPWSRREVLVCREYPAGPSLGKALSEGREDEGEEFHDLLDRTAEFLKSIHKAGFCHGSMSGKSIIVEESENGEGNILCLVDLEDMRWIGWMPMLLSGLWRGRALARFLQSLDFELEGRWKDRFFKVYFNDFVEGRHGQKLVLWAFERAGGARGSEPGPPATGSSSYVDHPGRAAG